MHREFNVCWMTWRAIFVRPQALVNIVGASFTCVVLGFKVWPGKYCSPRHPHKTETLVLELIGIK
jgi:hypothetical protein